MAKQQKSGGTCGKICWLVAAIAGGALIYLFLVELKQEILTSLLGGFGGMVLVGMVLGRLFCRGGKAADRADAPEADAASIRPKRYSELKVDKEATERPEIASAAVAAGAGLAAAGADGETPVDGAGPGEVAETPVVRPVKPVKPDRMKDVAAAFGGGASAKKTAAAADAAVSDGESDGEVEVERVVASIKRAANGDSAEHAPPEQPEPSGAEEPAVEEMLEAEAVALERALDVEAEEIAAAGMVDRQSSGLVHETVADPEDAKVEDAEIGGTLDANEPDAEEPAAADQDANEDIIDAETVDEAPAAATGTSKAQAVAEAIKAIALEVEQAEADDLAAYARAESVAVPDADRVYKTAIDTDETFNQKLASLTARAEAEDAAATAAGDDAAPQADPGAGAETPAPAPDDGEEARAAEADGGEAAEPSAAPETAAPATPDQQSPAPGKRAIAPLEPTGLSEPIDGQPDDLTRIDGIGEAQQAALNAAGIFHFAQFTSMNRRELAWLDANMQVMEGQPGAEAWRKQAIQISRNSE